MAVAVGALARITTTRDKSHFVLFDCFDGTLLDYFRASFRVPVDQQLRDVIPPLRERSVLISLTRPRSFRRLCGESARTLISHDT